MGAGAAPDAQEWRSLAMPKKELCLAFTLPTGQSFRWRKTGEDTYTGVIHQRVVQMRQKEDDVEYKVLARGENALPSDDADVLQDYFNAGTSLRELAQLWASKDPRFCNVHPYFPGARVLRQDPVECLFQFVCSSNNHISRIHGMVERLCRTYGTPLPVVDNAAADGLPEDLAFYAFPSLEQLQEATDDGLRAEGFGYRAKSVVGSVQMLMKKEGGGAAWLQGLRSVPYLEASEALCSLPGVGPKVAACVCLFSLDKHAAIPVDTHVWQLAVRYYTPHLKGKSLTKQLMVAVESALNDRFGSHAGWAHNTLFISELASQKHMLPAHLHPGYRGRTPKKGREPEEDAGADLDGPLTPPQQLGRGKRSAARSAGTKRGAPDAGAVKQELAQDSTADDTGLSQLAAAVPRTPAIHPLGAVANSKRRRQNRSTSTNCVKQEPVQDSMVDQDSASQPSTPLNAATALQLSAQHSKERRNSEAMLKVEGEQLQGSASVSKAIEEAAMEAFAKVRQVDATAKVDADAVASVTSEMQQAVQPGSRNRKDPKVAQKVALAQSADTKT